MPFNETLFKIVFALLVGAIIGLEREKNKQSNTNSTSIGIRTDILISLFGAISFLANQLFNPSIFIISFCAILVVGGISYTFNRLRSENNNLKTIMSSILVFLLGALCMSGEVQLAVVVAIIITFVLSLRYALHSTISKISYNEIIDGLKFLIIAFVVLPFLPNQAYDHQIIGAITDSPNQQVIEQVQDNTHNSATSPDLIEQSKPELSSPSKLVESDIINPYRIWMLIVIISGLNFLGYILVKILGKNSGYSLTGLIGGFYSSTITSLSLSNISKTQTNIKLPFISGILLSCATSFLKMFILIKAINTELFLKTFPGMGLMCGYLLIAGGTAQWLSHKYESTKSKEKETLTDIKSPLRLWSAVKIAIIVVITMIAANLILMYSDLNLYYVLAGLMAFLITDDPIIISTSEIAGQVISYDIAHDIILGVIFLNILQKVATIFIFGNRKLTKPLALAMSGLFLVTLLSFLYL